MTEHTPTPWELEAGTFGTTSICAGRHIIAQTYRCGEDASLPGEANAAFIVKACNERPTLLALVASLRSELVTISSIITARENFDKLDEDELEPIERMIMAIDEVVPATPAQSSKGE